MKFPFREVATRIANIPRRANETTKNEIRKKKKRKKHERNEEERETFSSEIDTAQFDGANCELDWIIQPAPEQVFSNLSL